MLRTQHLAAWAIAALAPGAWAAGHLCTMPNGVIIRMATSSCPRGAVKSEPDDGRTLPAKQVPIPRTEPPRPVLKTSPVPPPARPAHAPAAVPPAPAPATPGSAVDSAYAICKILKTLAGATTCDVNVNFFSINVIDATIATSARDAQAACQVIAAKTRFAGSPFAGGGWEMRVFHPMGSSTRPIASCTL